MGRQRSAAAPARNYVPPVPLPIPIVGPPEPALSPPVPTPAARAAIQPEFRMIDFLLNEGLFTRENSFMAATLMSRALSPTPTLSAPEMALTGVESSEIITLGSGDGIIRVLKLRAMSNYIFVLIPNLSPAFINWQATNHVWAAQGTGHVLQYAKTLAQSFAAVFDSLAASFRILLIGAFNPGPVVDTLLTFPGIRERCAGRSYTFGGLRSCDNDYKTGEATYGRNVFSVYSLLDYFRWFPRYDRDQEFRSDLLNHFPGIANVAAYAFNQNTRWFGNRVSFPPPEWVTRHEYMASLNNLPANLTTIYSTVSDIYYRMFTAEYLRRPYSQMRQEDQPPFASLRALNLANPNWVATYGPD